MDQSTERAHKERLQRIHDAVVLKEPDRVPIFSPATNTFDTLDAGYTMAETLYDFDKAKDAIKKFLTHYEPDSGYFAGSGLEGTGRILEKLDPKMLLWAGMPDRDIDARGIHQFLEFELIKDGEFDELMRDIGGFTASKLLPRAYGIYEPMAHFDFKDSMRMTVNYAAAAPLLASFSNPEVLKMISDLNEVGEMFNAYNAEVGAFIGELESMGFPVMMGGIDIVAFDYYSDYLRGTMLASADLYDDPGRLKAFLDYYSDIQLERMKKNPPIPGRLMFMPMHKGMDGFMSDEHYEQFYWPYLMKLVDAWIEAGGIPYVFTEGFYNSRLDFLQQLPKGKTVVHFEYVDIVEAKKALKDVACISGVYPSRLLEVGTPQEVADEAKRIMDILAPGGGYIFDVEGGIFDAKRENVETLFETVREYGRYR